MSRFSASLKFMLLIGASVWFGVVSGCTDNCTHYSENYVESGTGETCEICTDTPDDCSGMIPGTAVLSIHLSQPLPKLVRVYAGKAYETGTLVHQRVPTAKDFSVELPLGDYAATALYVTGGDSVLSVDGDELDYRKLGTCTDDCYVPEPGSVDLKRN